MDGAVRKIMILIDENKLLKKQIKLLDEKLADLEKENEKLMMILNGQPCLTNRPKE